MNVVRSIVDLRATLRECRAKGRRIGFVPTMGNLHAGHLALLDAARAAIDYVVVSIFVNPTQFGASEDLDRYPTTFDADCERLVEASADLLFAPTVSAMYPRGTTEHTRVSVPDLDAILCGAFRPGHFAGVATVVTKLFNLVGPDLAVFGEKDYQQLLVIKRMVSDLDLPIVINSVPTVREADGLAMSSRNSFLNSMERRLAPLVYGTLKQAAQALREGQRNYADIEHNGLTALTEAGFVPDYFSVRQAADLAVPSAETNDWRVLTAARLGTTRLIDNIAVHNPR